MKYKGYLRNIEFDDKEGKVKIFLQFYSVSPIGEETLLTTARPGNFDIKFLEVSDFANLDTSQKQDLIRAIIKKHCERLLVQEYSSVAGLYPQQKNNKEVSNSMFEELQPILSSNPELFTQEIDKAQVLVSSNDDGILDKQITILEDLNIVELPIP